MERRRQTRTPIQLPVKIRPKSDPKTGQKTEQKIDPRSEAQGGRPEHSGLTRDLTSNGIFLYTNSALEPGAKLELVMMLPPELGLGPGGWTLCQASVVRIERSDGKAMGVAATLDRIERLPELL